MQENGQSTVLFSDIRDFTEFTAKQGDEQAMRLSQLHREFATQTLKQLGFGALIKTYGDGVMLQFETPVQAVEAAIGLQHRANDHTQDAPNFPLLVGVGVHYGNVIEEDDDLFGLAVNLAKRLADEARSGQIVISRPVLEHIQDTARFEIVALGEREIKGMGKMALHEVVWRKEAMRLTTGDQALNLVLTSDDKLVIELGKQVRKELESLRAKMQQRDIGEAPALVQWVMKKSESWLPLLIDKALVALGIGIEHSLENVKLLTRGDQMERLTIQIGNRTFDLAQWKDHGFNPEELKRFIARVHERQARLAPAGAQGKSGRVAGQRPSESTRPLTITTTPHQGPFLKRLLIDLSHNTTARDWFSSLPMARSLVQRFVAGETLDEAVAVVKQLERQGILTTLNFLGEETHDPNDAKRATEEYVRALSAIEREGLQATVSVKPSQLGMAFDVGLLEQHLKALLDRAKPSRASICLDMEGAAYTQITLDLFKKLMLHGPVSTVLQANLRRTAVDLDDLIQWGAAVRLVKGAYLEPPDIAFAKKQDVDDAFEWMIDSCLRPESRSKGVYTAIATHDERVLRRACAKIEAESIPADDYEFQMLYGIRRDLQQRLADAGHRVRVYVSYGTEWYPYFMRRLAERPANILFLLKNLIRF